MAQNLTTFFRNSDTIYLTYPATWVLCSDKLAAIVESWPFACKYKNLYLYTSLSKSLIIDLICYILL